MKTKTIFLFAIITLLLVFSGCSQETEIPTKPLEKNEFNLLEINPNANEDEGKGELIIVKILENQRINLLGRILWCIENNMFSFVSDPAKVVFKNQIESVILMYNRKNMKGASQIIEKNILPKVHNVFSNNTDLVVVRIMLDIQKAFFDNPEIPDDITITLAIPVREIATALGLAIGLYQIIAPGPSVQCPSGQTHAGEGGNWKRVYYENGNLKCEEYYGYCTCYNGMTCD